MKVAGWVALFLATVLAVVGIVDLWLAIRYGMEETISNVVRQSVSKYPILAFLLGILIGHLIWPQIPANSQIREMTPEEFRRERLPPPEPGALPVLGQGVAINSDGSGACAEVH